MRIAFILGLLAFVALDRPAYAQDFKECFKATTDSDYARGVAVCTHLINSGKWTGSNLAILLLNRGQLHINFRKFDLALADISRAIDNDSNNSWAHSLRGQVLFERGEYQRAMVDFNHAIRIDPRFLSAYYDRGQTFEKFGDINSARANYQTVLDTPGGLNDEGQIRAVDTWAKQQARTALDRLGKGN